MELEKLLNRSSSSSGEWEEDVLRSGGAERSGETAMARWGGVARLRRALLLLALAATAAGLLLYWRQQAGESLYKDRKNSRGGQGAEPLWTWRCERERCVRSAASEGGELQSLATCNMLCGSTQLWPQPTGPVRLAATAVPVAADIFRLQVLTADDATRDLLRAAFDLLLTNLRRLEADGTAPLPAAVSRVLVRVALNGTAPSDTAPPTLRLDTDESYGFVLRLAGGALVADVTARSFYGARHALETLSQLVWLDPYAGGGTLMMLRAASVGDAPRFPFRGLLLDTSRNFFPLADILRTIDGMGASKLNTFHWHATDSQSFPLRAPSAPRLAERGAYDPALVYTAADVRAVVAHARLRGVRVLLEIDAPGHVGRAWSWGPEEGLGDLALCVELEPWRAYCGEPPCGQLNPRNDHVYDILEGLYRDVIELTGVTDVFHLGGDEVSQNCWAHSFNDTDPMELWQEFTARALERLRRAAGGTLPRVVLLWSSRLTQLPHLRRLDPATVAVQVWGGSQWPESEDVLRQGYRAVVSHVDAWYLDCGFGSWRDSGEGHCGPYRSWQRVYEHRPWGAGEPLVLGGEACLWSEQVDSNALDARVWPRAAALAERLWTDPPPAEAPPDAYLRLETHRARLASRGLRPAPLWPRWCADNPAACLGL